MNTKTKTMLALGIILITTVLVVVFTVKVKNQQKQISEATTQPTQAVQPAATAPTNTNETKVTTDNQDTKVFSTVALEGLVEKADSKTITLKNGEVVNEITFAQNFLIFTRVNGNVVKKQITDLKQGTKVQVNVRTSDSMVISVEILK